MKTVAKIRPLVKQNFVIRQISSCKIYKTNVNNINNKNTKIEQYNLTFALVLYLIVSSYVYYFQSPKISTVFSRVCIITKIN